MSFEVWLTDRDERYIVVKLRSTSRLFKFYRSGEMFYGCGQIAVRAEGIVFRYCQRRIFIFPLLSNCCQIQKIRVFEICTIPQKP